MSVGRVLRSPMRVWLQWTSAPAGVLKTPSTKTCSAGWVTRACITRASSRKLTRAKNYRPAGPKSQWIRPLIILYISMAVRSLKLLGWGSEVHNGTLLLLMTWYQKRAPARNKGTFSHEYRGGGKLPPPCPP